MHNADELHRVEVAIAAIDAGSLEWDSWAHSNVVALGLAAIRNPLGDALTHFLEHGGRLEAQRVVLLVSSALIRSGINKDTANKAAWDAFAIWNDSHCHTCGGRGVLTFQQEQCPMCGGTGERNHGQLGKEVRDAMAMLDASLAWMEGQLRAKMRG